METSIREKNRIFIQGGERPFRHLPPTAVPVKGHDFSHAIRGLIDKIGTKDEFVAALEKYIDNPYCFLTSSGRSALAIILLTLKQNSKRSKVIIPAYTCPTVAQAVLWAGLKPVFCDVDTKTLDMDRISLSMLLDSDVLAIIPTHLYGLAQDISDLLEIGQKFDIFIVEDAAQAFGATRNGRMVGNFGDFGFFSMGRGKCIPAGRGGVIVADDPFVPELVQNLRGRIVENKRWDFASLLKFLAYGLATTPLGWWFIARSPLNPAEDGMDLNELPTIKWFDVSSTHAGIGISILDRIERLNTVRRRNALRLMAILEEHNFVHIPKIPDASSPVFLRLPIVIDDKSRADNLYEVLSEKGIGVSRSYFRTLPDIFSSHSTSPLSMFPGANHLADCLLTLPTHPYLDEFDLINIQKVFQSIDT